MNEYPKNMIDKSQSNGMTVALSNEELRNWDNAMYNKKKLQGGNYDKTRTKLNFEIIRGKILPVQKDKPITERFKENLKRRGIIDPNTLPTKSKKPRITMVHLILGGNRERMHEICFENGPVDLKNRDADNSHIRRSANAERWAMDCYNFAANRWGEENIVSFIVHLDETNPHIHCSLLPIVDGKFSHNKIWGTPLTSGKILRELHTDFANDVGEKWGLHRGVDITVTGARHISTKEYRYGLEGKVKGLEHKISGLKDEESRRDEELSLKMARLKVLEKKEKSFTTMIKNLEKQLQEVQEKLSKAEEDLKKGVGDREEITKECKKLKDEEDEIKEKISKRQKDLASNNQELRELQNEIEKKKDELHGLEKESQGLKKEISKMSQISGAIKKSIEKDAMILAKAACFDEIMQGKPIGFSFENDIDGLKKEIMLSAEEICKQASSMFLHGLNIVDQATRVVPGGGGGGDSDDSWWKQKDEDDSWWMRRCLRRAGKKVQTLNGRSGRGSSVGRGGRR